MLGYKSGFEDFGVFRMIPTKFNKALFSVSLFGKHSDCPVSIHSP